MQTRFSHHTGGGNCLQAVVAAYFDLPMEAVPHFMLFGDTLYWEALRLFIKSLGHELLGWVDGEPPHDDKHYIISIDIGPQYPHHHAAICRNGVIVHDPSPNPKLPHERIAGYYSIRMK